VATASISEEKIDIGRVVQRGFTSMGRHIAPFFIVALLLGGLPTFLIYFFLLKNVETGDATMFVSPVYWLGTLVSMILGYLLQATLVRSSILDLSGRDPEIGPSLVHALKMILPITGLVILSAIVVGIGFLLLIVPGVIAYLMLIVALPALVEERRGVIDSMQRSRTLTAGSRARIFLLLLLFGVAYFIIATVIGVPFAAVGTSVIAIALGQAVVAALVALMGAAMLASLYVELRTVKEGATTEGLAAIFE
jgi:hypothetical protein